MEENIEENIDNVIWFLHELRAKFIVNHPEDVIDLINFIKNEIGSAINNAEVASRLIKEGEDQ